MRACCGRWSIPAKTVQKAAGGKLECSLMAEMCGCSSLWLDRSVLWVAAFQVLRWGFCLPYKHFHHFVCSSWHIIRLSTIWSLLMMTVALWNVAAQLTKLCPALQPLFLQEGLDMQSPQIASLLGTSEWFLYVTHALQESWCVSKSSFR